MSIDISRFGVGSSFLHIRNCTSCHLGSQLVETSEASKSILRRRSIRELIFLHVLTCVVFKALYTSIFFGGGVCISLWFKDFYACVDFQHKEDEDNYKIEVELLVRCNTNKWGMNWWMDEWMTVGKHGMNEWIDDMHPSKHIVMTPITVVRPKW